MTAIQPLVDAAAPNTTINLPDGEYDDPAPVYIRRDLLIQGSRNAVIHSEFQIVGGAMVRFNGPTFDMNKQGAPDHNGVSSVFPQNGMIVVLNSTLWLDDCEMRVSAGGAQTKSAIHLSGMSVLEARAVTQFSRIDWRNSPWTVIDINYGSYANIFDITPDHQAFNIIAGTTLNPAYPTVVAAIGVFGSKLTMSGSNLFNYGNVPYGINAGRDSYVQIGAGLYTTIQYFQTPVALDGMSRKLVAPGSLG